jgi:hypothetical protein
MSPHQLRLVDTPRASCSPRVLREVRHSPDRLGDQSGRSGPISDAIPARAWDRGGHGRDRVVGRVRPWAEDVHSNGALPRSRAGQRDRRAGCVRLRGGADVRLPRYVCCRRCRLASSAQLGFGSCRGEDRPVRATSAVISRSAAGLRHPTETLSWVRRHMAGDRCAVPCTQVGNRVRGPPGAGVTRPSAKSARAPFLSVPFTFGIP